MNINDFEKPKKHPFGMLEGYNHAYEKESVLTVILRKCIEINNFTAIKTVHNHPTMVSDGLLEKIADRKYKLTKKSIGLLYSQYAKKMNNVLIQYKGGGYDGCFWEWNYAVVVDGEFHDIYSGGRKGCKTREDMDAFIKDARAIDYWLYDIYSKEELAEFAKESNEGHVISVAQFLTKFDIAVYIECDLCGKNIKAANCIPGGYKGAGGIAMQATEAICATCQIEKRCDRCDEIDESVNYEKNDDYLCEYCREEQ